MFTRITLITFQIQGATSEIELVKGNTIRVTTEVEYMENCSADNLYVDYKNISKVVQKGSKIYIDDGLISLIVKDIGMRDQHY
jgi:pyruvate kinase